MSNGNVLIGIALDESGSMQPMTQATIEGVNAFLGEQRELDGTARISITLFNTSMKVHSAALDSRELADFHLKSYRPGGGTALFDAVGVTIKGMEKWLENNPGYDGDKLVVIWTDGMENSSRTFNQQSVNALIEEKKAEGWNFQFMGAGDGFLSAEHFTAIAPEFKHGFTNDSVGNHAAYAAFSASTKNLRGTGSYRGVS